MQNRHRQLKPWPNKLNNGCHKRTANAHSLEDLDVSRLGHRIGGLNEADKSHRLPPDWSAFLDDFQRHWPTDQDHTYVDFVRDGAVGNGGARMGNARWRRLTEERAGRAKSVFNFDVQGSVAKSTHAGIPWLRFIRQHLGSRVHFWPFDGWTIPVGRSALAEVYPALWSRSFAAEGRTPDQHDAYSIAAWLTCADRDGSLGTLLKPDLTPPERVVAQVEGWILGVPGLIRARRERDDPARHRGDCCPRDA